MGWTKWVDLELDDEDRLDTYLPIAMSDKPEYPCELRICLTGPTLEKLRAAGLEGDPAAGDMIDLRMMCKVTGVSLTEGEGVGSQAQRIELQPCMMALENENDEETP